MTREATGLAYRDHDDRKPGQALAHQNGSKARAFTSSVMPLPVSLTAIITKSPESPGGKRLALAATLAGFDKQRAADRHRVARVDRQIEDGNLDLSRIRGRRPERLR
jgi:hypothetical protein